MPRPQDVRIHRPDGTVIPCELSPLGVDENGYEVWEIATVMQPGDALEVDAWPAGTALVGSSAGWTPGMPYLKPQADHDELSRHDIAKLRADLNAGQAPVSQGLLTSLGGAAIIVALWLIRAARR